MDGLTIIRTDNGTHGEYRAIVEGSDHTGYLSWVQRGEAGNQVRVAEHTVVPPQIGGRGIALELVKALIDDAREQGFRVDPQCSYVAVQFARHMDWADLHA